MSHKSGLMATGNLMFAVCHKCDAKSTKDARRQAIPAAWPSGTGLSDKSSSDSAADDSPLSTISGGDAARVLLLERMLPTRLSSFVWILKPIRPQVTSYREEEIP